MEITLKITENTPSVDLMKTAAFLELLADTADMTTDSCSEETAEPAPIEDRTICEEPPQPEAVEAKVEEEVAAECKLSGQPEPEPEAPAKPEPKQEPQPEAVDPEAIRAQIRTLGGKLTAKGKAGDMLKIFEAHGVRKVKDLKPGDLPAVLKELEEL